MLVSRSVPDPLGNPFGLAVSTWQKKSPKADVKNTPVPPDHENESEECESCLDPI